jgi:predicted phosphodiesterase
MLLALLADIHGNLPALEAVLFDLQRYKPDAVYLVGDQINRCPWHNEVLDLLEDLGWLAIYGNHELIIGRINTPQNQPPFTDPKRFPTLWWTQSQLKEHHLQAIRRLPAEYTIRSESLPEIYLTHGIPGNPYRGILPEDSDAKIWGDLHTWRQLAPGELIVCAHTHRPLQRWLWRKFPEQDGVGDYSAYQGYYHPDEKRERELVRLGDGAGLHEPFRQLLVLNPGSVGMPYNGDPRAQYLLLRAREGKWQPIFRRIEYNRRKLRRAFAESSMHNEIGPEVELHLRTALTGLPWSSDFTFWLSRQPAEVQMDAASAVPIYLSLHGPGRWSFG